MSPTLIRLLSLFLAQTVHGFGDESKHDQTTLTAAFSDCALIRRGSNESSHDQTLSTACSGCETISEPVHFFEEVRMSRTIVW